MGSLCPTGRRAFDALDNEGDEDCQYYHEFDEESETQGEDFRYCESPDTPLLSENEEEEEEIPQKTLPMMAPQEYKGWSVNGMRVLIDQSDKEKRLRYLAKADPPAGTQGSVYVAVAMYEKYVNVSDSEPAFRYLVLEWHFGTEMKNEVIKSMEHRAIEHWTGFYRVASAHVLRKIDQYCLPAVSESG